MKRILCFIIAIFVSTFSVDAAVRTTTSTPRQNTVSRLNTNNTNKTTTTRTARAATTARSGTTVSRSAVKITPRQTTKQTIRRSGLGRAATTNVATNTFDSGYNVCRDAYFTCMDQFCALQNDSYRRCVCSSRLQEIQSREHALYEASDSLATFKDLNIDIISKTSAEVKAMISASAGERTKQYTKDSSNSNSTLNGISSILAKTKSKSLSTSGTLDIGGDINAIWANTDLTSGVNIANLSGGQLYNAVNAQCSEFVTDKCPSASVKNMVISAYGMYIENDCALLESALNNKKTQANQDIRTTEQLMGNARLDNYNAHNSTSINDCIAKIRSDITADSACGKNFVHCLDVSGLYLNRINGEPIYTPNFYQLETQLSLANDVLTNQTNRLLVAELNNKRKFATKSLDTCRDLSNDIWDEFLRQAITEIYQGQQSRIRQVKDECLDVVNTCYDEQTNSLRDFSNIDKNLLIGTSLELAEEMCREKLTTCSNLYGSGVNGMQELLTAMHRITDQKIETSCPTNLRSFVKDMCAVPSVDTLHSYPYACRVYMPGDQRFARDPECNQVLFREESTFNGSSYIPGITGYQNPALLGCDITYSECNTNNGYFYDAGSERCVVCPEGCATCTANKCLTCTDENMIPESTCKISKSESQSDTSDGCNDNGQYVGSLYQKLVRYALQVCIRQSQSGASATVPETVLQDISSLMYEVTADMGKELAKECERLGGIWISTPFASIESEEQVQSKLLKIFYDNTASNKQWGYCTNPETEETTDDETPEEQETGATTNTDAEQS
ncbi:MAG: hypothetical protein KBS86_01095 [Proteobacteria bacterium]|nr:hypothetical protein [Candidatus Enterousia scatequi]